MPEIVVKNERLAAETGRFQQILDLPGHRERVIDDTERIEVYCKFFRFQAVTDMLGKTRSHQHDPVVIGNPGGHGRHLNNRPQTFAFIG
jgi:hypothetical protein